MKRTRPPTKTSGKHFHAMAAQASSRRFSNEKVFCENSTYPRGHLKDRILKENLIEYVCAECGMLPEWNNKALVLHLDHTNGDGFDHRIENLRFLCPNCHAQTETYSRGQRIKNNKQRRIELNAANIT